MSDYPLASAMASGGVWRLGVDLRDLAERPLEALRLLLVADVLRRLVEDLRGGQMLLAVLEYVSETTTARTAAANALWIRDPSTRTSSAADAASFLGGPPSVVIELAHAAGFNAGVPVLSRTLRIGTVTTPAPTGAAPLASEFLSGHEPLALRLALLRFSHESPAMLSTARLHRAEETLQRWRFKVAGWADLPSAPVPPDRVDLMRVALDELDTATVLTSLHRLEVDPGVASGSKFETFAYLDRVLALDLCHSVGRRFGG
jgi:hypothetical protein